jgi:hypothetical protein
MPENTIFPAGSSTNVWGGDLGVEILRQVMIPIDQNRIRQMMLGNESSKLPSWHGEVVTVHRHPSVSI